MRRWGARSLLKGGAVGITALFLAAACFRSAAVSAWSESAPEKAASFWPGHPRVGTALALRDIGAAAARGQAPPPAVLDRVEAIVRRDPLAVDPFSVAGTAALAEGDVVQATTLLSEALDRDPRALAPRVLLADLLLRTGQVEGGLRQIQVLVRHLPQASGPVVASLASFAREPGAMAQLKSVLARDADLRNAVLLALSTDPGAADTILALQDPKVGTGSEGERAWQQQLLNGLIEQQQYAKAFQIWRRLFGVTVAEPGLFNFAFAVRPEVPPFNWSLTAGSGGVAEPIPGGLRLVHYGREDAVLARQLTVLEPGVYRLTWRVEGRADALHIAATCLPAGHELARARLAARSLALSIPPGCDAQRIDFAGTSSDTGSTTEARISGLHLLRGR